jgi:hypothetical protein
VGLFRRRQETLNEQLLREAGLDPAQMLGDSAPSPPSAPPPPSLDPLEPMRLRRGAPDGSTLQPRDWDAAVTVTVPELAGDEVKFTTIPNGDVIVSEESGDSDLSPLADAVEKKIDPPYRAVAARQDGALWAVCARRIQVAQIPFPAGEKLELSWNGEDEALRVDGEASDADIPRELEEIGEAAGQSYYVDALRIDGDLWEVRATAF